MVMLAATKRAGHIRPRRFERGGKYTFVTDVRAVATEELVGSFSSEHHFHPLKASMFGEQHERQGRRIRHGIIVKEHQSSKRERKSSPVTQRRGGVVRDDSPPVTRSWLSSSLLCVPTVNASIGACRATSAARRLESTPPERKRPTGTRPRGVRERRRLRRSELVLRRRPDPRALASSLEASSSAARVPATDTVESGPAARRQLVDAFEQGHRRDRCTKHEEVRQRSRTELGLNPAAGENRFRLAGENKSIVLLVRSRAV